MAVTQCLRSALLKHSLKTKTGSNPRLDTICPCDQHCFASTTTYSEENQIINHQNNLSATEKCRFNALHTGRTKDGWPVVWSDILKPFPSSWNRVVPEKYITSFLPFKTTPSLRCDQTWIKRCYNWVNTALTSFCSTITLVTVDPSLQELNARVLKLRNVEKSSVLLFLH